MVLMKHNDTITRLTPDDLDVTAIAVSISPLPEHASVSDVFPYLYEHGLALIVDSKGFLVRLINNIRLEDDHPTPVDAELQCLYHHARVREARHIFETTAQRLIPLLDDKGRYTGFCASRNELLKLWAGQFEMPRIGGLATPLGVYLTTSIHTAGAGNYGLVLTGIIFAFFVLISQRGFIYLMSYFPEIQSFNYIIQMSIVFALLLLIIRFSPLAGLHAAEHQTIHVIEKGLPLTPDNVLAQPRSHHRCGTNIMVGLVGIEMGVWGAITIEPVEYSIVFFVIWLILLIIGWQQLGLLIQRLFTTAKPSRRQVENAIKAGKALIEKYRQRPHGAPNLWQRVWGSGMLQIMISFLLTYWICHQIIDIWMRHFSSVFV